MFWKKFFWLKIIPKLLSEEDLDIDSEVPVEPEELSKSSKFERWKSPFSPKGIDPKKKSKILKLLFFALIFLVIYFVFINGRAKRINKLELCKNGECKNGILKLDEDSISLNNGELMNKVYSEQISSLGNGENVFTIYAKSNSNVWVSFNIKRITTGSSNGQKNGLTRYYEWLGGDGSTTCRIKTGEKCDSGCCEKNGEKCCCCAKEGECKGCCCGADGKCCTENGKNCCCCNFIKLIEVAILNPQDPNRLTATKVFFSLLPTLLYLMVFIFIARGAAKGGLGLYGGKGSIFGIGKSLSKTNKANVTFKDVAGIKEEKHELEEIVDFLKRPKKYASMGARIPKGVILYGPPGTGKTLLAKAVSGESNVPFLEASGASFDDMFVGVGAKRVRELFEKAKKLSPCIIFIDEIDALAGKRGGKFNIQGNEQTINQLLSEMDGFNTQSGIIIIAATNRLESIDPAVLRPGRFDRHIQIDLPDISERREILVLHAKNKNLSNRVNLEEIARKTPGFSGAQLENVLNEAALLAVRENKRTISTREIDEAIDRAMAGPAKRGRKISFSEKRQIAYHEAGHAIAGIYTQDGEIVEKITIIPRGKAAGYVLSAPKEQESVIKTKAQLLASILTMLAGRASEELFFGRENISTGASNDLYKATKIAKNIVLRFGMTNSAGMVQYLPSEEDENPYKNSYSDSFAEIIDRELQKIIDEQYALAKEIIEKHKREFLLIVETLLLLETIDRAQIEFIHKYKRIPKEAELERERLKKEEGNKYTEIFNF